MCDGSGPPWDVGQGPGLGLEFCRGDPTWLALTPLSLLQPPITTSTSSSSFSQVRLSYEAGC